MATLYVSEFAGPGSIGTTKVPYGGQPSLADQTVAVAAGSAQSNAFGATTHMVLLSSDVVCSVKFGNNPTATATNFRLPANSPQYFAVNPGDKVAVITNT